MINYVRRNLKYAYPSNWKVGFKAIKRRSTLSGIIDDPADLGMATLLPSMKLDMILTTFSPESVLDVGCGTGASLKYLRAKGVDAFGIEASKAGIAASGVSEFIARRDLRKPIDLKRRFDLVWCFEVAEHLHAKYADVFLDTLTRHGNLIVMSAAPPGQGGEGHFNEQPQKYWIEKMAQRGMALHEATGAMQAVPEFYSENMMVFARI